MGDEDVPIADADPAVEHTGLAVLVSEQVPAADDKGNQAQQQAAGGSLQQGGSGMLATATADADAPIASEADLEAFGRQPIEERMLTGPLRGVLAETAVTGVVRYKWSLLRPLVEFAMEKVMRDYDVQNHETVGPSRCAHYGETVLQTIERFKSLLSSFTHAPWTLQRLCELVLEPRKQYSQLHKVSLAIEKCLLVTSEVPPAPDPPPAPRLGQLSAVNTNPPAVYQSAAAQAAAGHAAAEAEGGRARADADVSSAFVGSILEAKGGLPAAGGAGAHGSGAAGSGAAGSGAHGHRHHHTTGNHTGAMEHIEEDHWPENKPGFSALHHHHSPHHHPQQSPPQPPLSASQPHLPAPHMLLQLHGGQQQLRPAQQAAGEAGSNGIVDISIPGQIAGSSGSSAEAAAAEVQAAASGQQGDVAMHSAEAASEAKQDQQQQQQGKEEERVGQPQAMVAEPPAGDPMVE